MTTVRVVDCYSVYRIVAEVISGPTERLKANGMLFKTFLSSFLFSFSCTLVHSCSQLIVVSSLLIMMKRVNCKFLRLNNRRWWTKVGRSASLRNERKRRWSLMRLCFSEPLLRIAKCLARKQCVYGGNRCGGKSVGIKLGFILDRSIKPRS